MYYQIIKDFFRIDYFLIIILALVPISLISGPFLPDLFISICGIIIITLILYRKEYSFFNNNFFYLFSIWLIYLIIRSLFSENILLSLESSLFYFRFLIFSISIWYFLKNYPQFKMILFSSFLLSYFFILLVTYHQFFFGSNVFTGDFIKLDTHFHTRLHGPFYEPVLGNYLAKFLPVIISLYFLNNYKNLYFKIFLFLIINLSSILIFITGERNAALFLIIVFLFTILNKSIKLLYKLFFIFSFSFCLFSSFLLFSSLKYRLYFTISQLNIFNQNILSENSYLRYFLSAIKMFQENIFFGVGPKLFRHHCKDYISMIPDSCSTHPHNMYMQLLAEVGILGTIPILFLFILFSFMLLRLIFIKVIGNYDLYNAKYYIIVFFFINLFPLIGSNNIFNNYTNIFYYLPIGIMLYIFNYNNETR